VKVRIDWTDRELAALWVNQIVAMTNEDMRAKAIDETSQTLQYLDMEHEKTESVALRAAIYSMIESQLKAKTMATVRKQYAFEVLDPAMPPDPDTVLRPRRVLYLVTGLALGILFGVLGAILINSRRLNVSLAPTSANE
jgi:uncharacterized protein involved in exopolysaccharide biosynthesis